MSYIDLHIHSNISLDGTCSIREIIEISKLNRMKTIAITDHNSVKGVHEAMQLGKENNIRVIPGIEIDCNYKRIDFHMTAYNIDIHDIRYEDIENYTLENARINSWKSVNKFLNETNIKVSKAALEAISVQGILVPEDLCDYLLSNDEYNDLEILKAYRKGGDRSNNPNVNFYWDYFSQGKVGYFKEERLNALDVVKIIHETGGITVIAHPKANFKDKDDILEELLSYVDGIEVFSTYHDLEDCEKYFELANKHCLKITCGSDFHGIHKPNIQIGNILGRNIEKHVSL